MMVDPLHDQLPSRVAERLRQPLPGRRAHRRLGAGLSYGRHAGPPAFDARAAAVLACLCPGEGQWQIPLTLRPAHMIDHARQISFPGGTCEAGESAESCARREYEEELGADAASLILLGRLTPLYVFASNFLVTPCVAVARSRPQWRPNTHEVERVVELPLRVLLDDRHWGTHAIERHGFRFTTRHICCGEDLVWGATGMILAELAAVVADVLR
jgi:8-oxo-dGTP pyrophosphatase MutT (NUDIX family)